MWQRGRMRRPSPLAAVMLAIVPVVVLVVVPLVAALTGPSSLASAGDAPGFVPERLARVPALLDDVVQRAEHAGASCVVWHRGQRVLQHATGLADVDTKVPMREDTLVRAYSMTKPITAAAALVLVERGELRLDQPIRELLPELAAPQVFVGGTAEAPQLVPAARPITVRMLLNHTAGFSYDFYSDSPLHDLYRRADLWGSGTSEQFLQRAAALPLYAQPGEHWHYSIADDVLGVLLERRTGQSLAALVRTTITVPLGMVDTDFDVVGERLPRLATLHRHEGPALVPAAATFGAFAEPGRGFPAGGAGLFTTLADYERFARWLVGDGSLDGVRVLGRKTMELLRSDSLGQGLRTSRPADGWGLVSAVVREPGLGTDLMGVGTLHWSGAATTTFFADPHEQLVAVLFVQHLPYDEHKLTTRFRTAVYQALR